LTDPSGEIVWQIPVFIIGALLATHGNENWRMVGQIMMMAAMSSQGGLIEAGLGNATEVAAVAANGGAAATGWLGAPSVFNAGAWANSALSAAVSSAVAGNSGEQTMLAALTAVGFSAAGSMAGAGGQLTGQQLGMHMLMGCVQSSMSGGQCGPGAIAAGVSKVASYGMQGADLHWTTHGMATMVVGGTASVMGGGKFANGALSAGMGYLFNWCGTNACGDDDGDMSSPEGNRQGLDSAPGDEAGLVVLGGLAVIASGGASVGYAKLVLAARTYGVSADYLSKVYAGLLPEVTKGTTLAANAAEALAMKQAKAGAGRIIKKVGELDDPRLKGAAWEKIHHSARVDGKTGVVHYLREQRTRNVQDFKFPKK